MNFEPSDLDAETGLTDISHRPKAMVHGPAEDPNMDPKPGEAIWNGQAYIAANKPGERLIFDIAGPLAPQWKSPHYTDLTHALLLLALWGKGAVEVMQRIVAVDFEQPEKSGAFFLTTRCHSIVLHVLNCKTQIPIFLLSCARSHGQNIYDTILECGRHLGLRPTGLRTFSQKPGRMIGI
jgi:glycine cleavage system aminomethyltransferase T